MKSVTYRIISPQRQRPVANSRRAVALTLLLLLLPGLLSAQTLLHRLQLHQRCVRSRWAAPRGTARWSRPDGRSPPPSPTALTLPGGGGPGFSGYLSLPAGILTNTASLTVECARATQNSAQTWAELGELQQWHRPVHRVHSLPEQQQQQHVHGDKNGNGVSDAFSPVQFPERGGAIRCRDVQRFDFGRQPLYQRRVDRLG